MKLQAFVINMESSKDRLDAVDQMLRRFDFAYERVEAFDGRSLDLAGISDYDELRAQKYMGRSLVGGEIGCYYSHLRAASRFLSSPATYGLVLEDDVVFRSDPFKLLERILPDLDRHNPKWLVINIGSRRDRLSSPIRTYAAEDYKYCLSAAHYFPMMSCALVWSREGARQFVENHDKIFAPVDNYFRHWLTRTGSGYTVWPPPVTTTDAESQIVSADGRPRNSHRRKWYYSYAKHKRLLTDKIIALSKKLKFAIDHGASDGGGLRGGRNE